MRMSIGIFFESKYHMNESIENKRFGGRCDAAILFLRIFIGGVMLMHILGNLQDYDNIVGTYQSILGMSGSASLIAVMMAEGVAAAMIISGFGTRFAAVVMIVVWALTLIREAAAGAVTSDAAKLHFVYLGIYITLVVSGGGAYAFNVPNASDKMS